MNDPDSDIKSMKLYHHLNRVMNELRELGKDETEVLRVDELSGFDQLHYHGTEAVDEAIRAVGINEHSTVLEIGSGLGGPARYLAAATGAEVTALELQEDHHLMASDLTARCGLGGSVKHLCGDFLTHPWDGERFQAIVSWLALYHIPQREVLLERCRSLLEIGGFVYAEDLCERRPFDDLEKEELEVRALRQLSTHPGPVPAGSGRLRFRGGPAGGHVGRLDGFHPGTPGPVSRASGSTPPGPW